MRRPGRLRPAAIGRFRDGADRRRPRLNSRRTDRLHGEQQLDHHQGADAARPDPLRPEWDGLRSDSQSAARGRLCVHGQVALQRFRVPRPGGRILAAASPATRRRPAPVPCLRRSSRSRILRPLGTSYSAKIARLRTAALEQPGELSPQERRACTEGEPPERLAGYVDKVRRHAYQVTDDDIETLRRAGCSEDQIFEATVCAAVGAGLGRLERGLALLEEDADEAA